MTSVINTNLASMFAQNALSGAQKGLSTSVQRLSSGLRINSAADDAAGLSVAQNMQSQINAINMGVRNVGDATNLLTTADSSLSNIQDMLLRMKSLVVEGKNDSLSYAQKGNINTELTEIKNEMNNVATRTTFNGNNLLANAGITNSGTLVAGVAAGTNATVAEVTFTGTKVQAYTIDSPTAGNVRITGADGISQTVAMATNAVSGSSNTYDWSALGIKIKINTTGTGSTNLLQAVALGGTAGGGGTPLTLTLAGGASSTLAFQTGAATTDTYSYSALNVLTTGTDAVFTNIDVSIAAVQTQINGSLSTTAAFNTMSDRIDLAIDKINTQRALLGSQMNRLSYTNTNLLAQSTNMQQSRSAVIDTDFAKETAGLTKGQIMQQAATAMLAQANQMPNVILSLLK